jgi:hypothetical protein
LKVVEVQVGRSTFLDDDDFDIKIELSGFPKKMDGEEPAGPPPTMTTRSPFRRLVD